MAHDPTKRIPRVGDRIVDNRNEEHYVITDVTPKDCGYAVGWKRVHKEVGRVSIADLPRRFRYAQMPDPASKSTVTPTPTVPPTPTLKGFSPIW